MSDPSSIFSLAARGRSAQATDLHIEPMQGAAYRIFTHIERIDGVKLDAVDVESFLEQTMDRISRARLERLGMADYMYTAEGTGALRIHASRGKNGARLAIRLLASAVPELTQLGLPAAVEAFCDYRAGLIIVNGPPGSGKSTLLASLLDRLNASCKKHIVSFEDPVEYTHRWQRSIICQYEVGRDVASFADGVRGALRADPDVLFIGEVRSADTVSAALEAAETGHLVFATLHTPSESSYAVSRLASLFASDEHERARSRLADSLRAIVSLRLLPMRNGLGLRAAAEILIVTDAVRRMIRDGVTHQLRGTIGSSKREGSQTLEAHLSELVASGEVELATARGASFYPDEVRETVPAEYRRR